MPMQILSVYSSPHVLLSAPTYLQQPQNPSKEKAHLWIYTGYIHQAPSLLSMFLDH